MTTWLVHPHYAVYVLTSDGDLVWLSMYMDTRHAPVVAREFNNDERLHTAVVYISVLSTMFLLISIISMNHVRWMGSARYGRPMLMAYGLIWSLEPQCIYNDVFLFNLVIISFGGCLLYTITS